jgi:hypothetical protein
VPISSLRRSTRSAAVPPHGPNSSDGIPARGQHQAQFRRRAGEPQDQPADGGLLYEGAAGRGDLTREVQPERPRTQRTERPPPAGGPDMITWCRPGPRAMLRRLSTLLLDVGRGLGHDSQPLAVHSAPSLSAITLVSGLARRNGRADAGAQAMLTPLAARAAHLNDEPGAVPGPGCVPSAASAPPYLVLEADEGAPVARPLSAATCRPSAPRPRAIPSKGGHSACSHGVGPDATGG